MLTAIVKFQTANPHTLEQAREAMLDNVAMVRPVEGLIRKYYILSDDGLSMGGVYLWETRADADRFYAKLRPMLKEKFGAEPTIQFFRSPVVVDNVTGEVIQDVHANA